MLPGIGCAHSKHCAANVSTECAKKNAPMSKHRCMLGHVSWALPTRSKCLALVPLVPVARAQLLVLVLAHLLAALLDHTAHGKLRPPLSSGGRSYPCAVECQAP